MIGRTAGRFTRSGQRVRGQLLVTSCMLALTSYGSYGALQPGPVTLRVSLPRSAPAGICSVLRAGEVVARSVPGSLDLDCSRLSDLIRCDGLEYEPLDAAVSQACQARAVPVRRASEVPLGRLAGDLVTVEWMNRVRDELIVVATRQFRTQPAPIIRIAKVPGRLVRILQTGNSPRTMSAQSLLAGRPLIGALSGGEIVGLVAAMTTRPKEFHIDGRSSQVLQLQDDMISAAGLAPGTYTIRPMYLGGMFGSPAQVNVEAERSTFVRIGPEQLGSLSARLDTNDCSSGVGNSAGGCRRNRRR